MKKALFTCLALLLTCTAAMAQNSVNLPQPDNNLLKMSLGNTLMQRRSGRSYDATREITQQQLSTLLWAACGVSDKASGKITAPSAVNMQDIKVYVCRKDGAWLYDAKANTLTQVSNADLRPDMAAGQPFVNDAPVNLLLVSDQSGRRKNDAWGNMDSGYVSQNIYLACTAMGLQTVARAMMNKDAVRKALNLADGVDVMLNHPVGYAK
jgi:nitroreductase